jgi:hypothetical protein
MNAMEKDVDFLLQFNSDFIFLVQLYAILWKIFWSRKILSEILSCFEGKKFPISF